MQLPRLKEGLPIVLNSLESSLRETRLSKTIASERFDLDQEQHRATLEEFNGKIESTRQAANDRYQLSKIAYHKARDLFRLRLYRVYPDIDKKLQPGTEQLSNLVAIKAPMDGIVAELLLHNPGESIERGKTILSLVPAGVPMLMQLRIPDKDIGKITRGQQVKFKFEAFPFAENGVLHGLIESIGPVKVGDDGAQYGKYYHATSGLNQEYFRVDGLPFQLLPGMSATAEIRTEQKRIIDLLIAPVSKLAKAKSAEE